MNVVLRCGLSFSNLLSAYLSEESLEPWNQQEQYYNDRNRFHGFEKILPFQTSWRELCVQWLTKKLMRETATGRLTLSPRVWEGVRCHGIFSFTFGFLMVAPDRFLILQELTSRATEIPFISLLSP